MSDQFEIVCSDNVIAAQYGRHWLEKADPKILTKKIFESVKTLPGSEWAFYDDIRNWPVKVPEHIRFCANSAHQLAELGMTHCVVCANGVAISEWMMKIIVPEHVTLLFVEKPELGFQKLEEFGFGTRTLNFQKSFVPMEKP